MTAEEKREARETERLIVEQGGGSDPAWTRWMLLILVLEVIYIALEFGFNAALLNVASGLFPDPGTLDEIELYGRLLSGVGFGFLLYGLFGMKYRGRIFRKEKQAMMLLGIMPVAMVSMYMMQELLIEDVIVESSTHDGRFAATYLNMVRPAIRNGTLIIEDVPITAETSDRPENKAFLAIAGMLMASNDDVVTRIPREIDNIVGSMVHREALDSSEASYDAYLQVDQRIAQFYKQFREQQDKKPERIASALKELKGSQFYNSFNKELRDAYYHYASGAKAVYEAIGSKSYFKPYYVASACNPRKTTYRESTCRASMKKNGGAYYEATGSQLNVLKFCDLRKMGHQQCDWSAERVGRLVYADMTPAKRKSAPIALNVKGIPLGLNKRQFYTHAAFARNFGTQRHNGMSISANDIVLSSDGTPNTEATLKRAISKKIHDEMAYLANTELSSGADDIRPDMSKSEFYRSDEIQSAYRALFGEYDDKTVYPEGLSSSEFLNRVLLPKSWKAVEERLDGIPRSVEQMKSDDIMTEQGKQAIRAMVVPPIALLFSLFFSLFTLSKVFHHMAAIGYIKKPKTFPLRRAKMMISGSFLLVVLSFPYFLTENPMVKTGIVDAASGEVKDERLLTKSVILAMDWMIRAEPAIYPIGNALIGIPMMPFSAWHDANAQEIGSDDVAKLKAVTLVSSMSVTEVQKALNALGYNAGAVDGLMGSNTMKALKAFQRDHNLDPSGVIDAETTLTLKNL